ncbi:hypothetical protein COU19_00415 [Candidatus Kaiserbacteria bacterium CG10_big_fil_rev_8_21_14_0_10_56_12]|uniref:HIT domain-containing protein n=1 Tax=Candidatus Kaiserbacteria bacterium CG10_big_fil_rev_8_21_14_0_10_56_12 TaxID=1974611 RepID=A0A2H0UAP0_9BACT|nr:MAG: hypothetical protein COU19_00415 [Candidatus Kaiserbacteria bacterium CG10_big_fil_rev_8_21_14_0_10_56_12]
MDLLANPIPEAVFFEEDKLYVCLASFPIARGHTIVVWKEAIVDLNLLGRHDYEHLMDTVNVIREALLKALQVEKVYLLYMDEARHVHWYLVPRYNEEGINALSHEPTRISDFSLAKEIKDELKNLV